jgi:hypothetical protein
MTRITPGYAWIGLFVAVVSPPLFGQRDPGYDHSVVTQTRIDLRDLGYPPVDVIPPDENAIRALTIAPDSRLFGATGGKRSHLFIRFVPGRSPVPRCFIR